MNLNDVCINLTHTLSYINIRMFPFIFPIQLQEINVIDWAVAHVMSLLCLHCSQDADSDKWWC